MVATPIGPFTALVDADGAVLASGWTADAEGLRHRVGLRPARSSVRLERDGRVVHCYGHGGAGVTLAWGCAAEVAGLVSGA